MTVGSGDTFGAAAYGGDGWRPRLQSHRDEIGSLWAARDQTSEWAPLAAVMLHRPGIEVVAKADADALLQLAGLDLGRAQAKHDRLAEARHFGPAGGRAACRRGALGCSTAGAVGCLTGVLCRASA